MQRLCTQIKPLFPSGLAWDFGTGVFTLMELLEFYAGVFCRISGILGQSWVLINRGEPLSSFVDTLGGNLGELRQECGKLELSHTLAHLNRLLSDFEGQNRPSLLHLARQLGEVQQRLIDELNERSMVTIPKTRVNYYESDNLFGEQVASHFPSVATDIAEAGKCLALNRNTASVFHLMRIMESGLRALSSSLADPRLDPKRNPSWETILKKCDEELVKPLQERMPTWRTDELFYSTVTANLRAVKNAWRNPTMHIEQTYTDETALRVWNAVDGFMRHLATKLSEISA